MRNLLRLSLAGILLAGGLGCSSPGAPAGPSNSNASSAPPVTVFFMSQRAGNSDNIFSVVQGSSSVVTLTSYTGSTGATDPAYSPTAQRIVYELYGSTQELVTCKADGSQPATLSSTGSYQPQDPAWSPDGTQIAFGCAAGIIKVTSLGSGAATLSTTGSQPSWSPDGTRIAFNNNGRLCTMSAADGSGVTDLSALSLGSVTGVVDEYPAWSPDGGQIAFVSNRNASSTGTQSYYQVFRMAANGSGVSEVTAYSTTPGLSRDAYELRWSPDGVHVLYTSDQNGGSNAGIFQVNPDGTGQTALAVNAISANEIVGDY